MQHQTYSLLQLRIGHITCLCYNLMMSSIKTIMYKLHSVLTWILNSCCMSVQRGTVLWVFLLWLRGTDVARWTTMCRLDSFHSMRITKIVHRSAGETQTSVGLLTETQFHCQHVVRGCQLLALTVKSSRKGVGLGWKTSSVNQWRSSFIQASCDLIRMEKNLQKLLTRTTVWSNETKELLLRWPYVW